MDSEPVSPASTSDLLPHVVGLEVESSGPTPSPSPPLPPSSSVWVRLAVAGVATAIGALIIVQTSLNVALGTALGSPLRSAAWNYLSGLLALLLIMAFNHAKRRREQPPTFNRIPFFGYFSGVFGAVYVISSIAVAPHLTSTLFFLMAVLGQTSCSLILDHTGCFPPGVEHVIHRATPPKLFGVTLLIAGCVLVAVGTLDVDLSALELVALSIVALLAGVALPLQVAVNKSLTTILESGTKSTLVSFATGSCVTVTVALCGWAIDPATPASTDFKNWIGGLVGLAFVGGGSVFPHLVGIAFYFCFVVFGEVAAALLIDHFGVLGFKTVRAGAARLVGCSLAFIGVALVQFSTKRTTTAK